ncbi:hypothetical protein OY671_010795, partial [Metschnikowia pulcherrima]
RTGGQGGNSDQVRSERPFRRAGRGGTDDSRRRGLCRHCRAGPGAGAGRRNRRRVRLCAGRAQPLRRGFAHVLVRRDPGRRAGPPAVRCRDARGAGDGAGRHDRADLPGRGAVPAGQPVRLRLARGAARLRLWPRHHHRHPAIA